LLSDGFIVPVASGPLCGIDIGRGSHRPTLHLAKFVVKKSVHNLHVWIYAVAGTESMQFQSPVASLEGIILLIPPCWWVLAFLY
jgi:hypothetical protein